MDKIKLQLIFCLLPALLFSQSVLAQLSNFTLTVGKTNETCTANGTLTFSVSGTTAGATILYSIYHLPNVVTPIAVLAGNTFTGLTAGNYRVVATQSLGNESVTQQQDATIMSQITPLVFHLVGNNIGCNGGGQVTVVVTAGIAVSYEIFSGPVIRPLQSSNVFSGLVAGLYSIRVFDNCGEGTVQTITIGTTVTGIVFTGQGANTVGCTSIETANSIENISNGTIQYPLAVVYTLSPPAGPTVSYAQNIANGDAHASAIYQTIPLYYDQNCSYQIQITDGCGAIYTSVVYVVHPKMKLTLASSSPSCSQRSIEVKMNNFGVPPMTIDFLSAPPGFNPTVFNPQHPNPNNSATFASYSNDNITLPAGQYTVKITDSCGRTDTQTVTIVYDAHTPYPLQADVIPACDLGFGTMELSNAMYGISHATIIAAPAAYPFALPQKCR